MKIHGDLLFYWIHKKYPAAFAHLSKNYQVTRPMFPDKMDKIRNHFIVMDKSYGIQSVAVCEGAIFLFLGFSERELKGNPNEYIAIPEERQLTEVFNQVLEIFEMFQELENNLEDAVHTYFSYSAILHSCDTLIDAPVALLDTQFRYVGYSKRLAFECGFEDKYVGDNNYLPLEEINQLNAMPDFNGLQNIQEVFQYVCVENMIHKNIFHSGEYVGRLGIPWSKDPAVNRYHAQLLLVLAQYVEELYDMFGTFWRVKKSDTRFKKALMRLLDGESLDQDHLNRLLNSREFGLKDTYCLIQFTSGFTDNGKDTTAALAARLEGIWPGTCCLLYRSKFIALVNLTKYESTADNYFHQDLAYFLRESLLQAGVSRKFQDLFLMKTAYRQTEIALEEGPLTDTTYWYFKFDDYAYEHLLRRGYQNFMPDQICHRAIGVLMAYDEENHTQLNLTLKTFIRLQYNAAAASKELYIARSSFLKRMSRIEKLTGIRLDNYRDRVYLALSYEIMEHFNYNGENISSVAGLK